MKKLYLIPALVCVVLGLFLKFALIGYSFLAYGFFAAALIILFYFVLRLLKEKYPKFVKVLNNIFTYGLILFLMVLAVTEAAIIGETKMSEDASADYAIVFGAGVNGTVPSRSLKARLVAARDFAQKYPETKIIVSGGQGSGEAISEAECMKTWLVSEGIEADRIIEENKARSTYENVKYSYEIITSETPDFNGRVCLITEGYHILRAKLMAKDFDLDTAVYSGKTGLPVLTVNYYFREAFAVWKYFVFG